MIYSACTFLLSPVHAAGVPSAPAGGEVRVPASPPLVSAASALTPPPSADAKTSGGDWLNVLPAASSRSESLGLGEASRLSEHVEHVAGSRIILNGRDASD
jgi:hypothetical protein